MEEKNEYTIIAIMIITIILIVIKFLMYGMDTEYINGMPGPILSFENRKNS